MISPAPLLDTSDFDKTPALSTHERDALIVLRPHLRRYRRNDAALPDWDRIRRLLVPLDAARLMLHRPSDTPQRRRAAMDAVGIVLRRCEGTGTTYWSWSEDSWGQFVDQDGCMIVEPWPRWVDASVRFQVVAYAYLLCGFTAFYRLKCFNRLALAYRLFDREAVEIAKNRIATKLEEWGYHSARAPGMSSTIAELLLGGRSAHVEDLTDGVFAQMRDRLFLSRHRIPLHAIHRAVAALGFVQSPVPLSKFKQATLEDASSEWMKWVDRWFNTSTLAPDVRRMFRINLAMTGRWLAAERSNVVTPADWTRETCAAWIARAVRLRVGDYARRRVGLGDRVGRPLAPTTVSNYISATRILLRDCQEWGWCPRRFDPIVALATPRSVLAMIGPKPRVIADDAWAKLLWAGLNLDATDLAAAGLRAYPLALIRALALAWLFAGQRSDEIIRLRVGCIRWQPSGTGHTRGPICLLDVPVHKTGTAFAKPVDSLLGRAIEAWEAIRPAQPPMTDPKTGEIVDLLFTYRAVMVAKDYINEKIIPILCRKAGIPDHDVRGRITSHRARATIASQLYNAKEPMTLFELQAWLGHRSPRSTQYYAQITPNTLTKAYTDAGYFARNVRTIEVLIDREAVLNGAAAAGQPWQHYDLGHGYCSYTFFEQCPHRMACARCDFYIPKPSSRAQLLEAKANVDRRLALIPLTDDELAAVEQDRKAVEKLLGDLADKPTPSGQTPRELHALRSSQLQCLLGKTSNSPG